MGSKRVGHTGQLTHFHFKEQRNSLGLGVNNKERSDWKVWGSESSGTLEKQDFVRKFWFLTYEFPPQTF